MKRPLQLSLAIALALGVTDAFALGLGAIQVRSGLNQPLIAEIPIIQGAPGEAEGLVVQLASDEDFERVGLSRSSIGVPVEFSLGKNARGEPVIKVSSAEIVREPFLGFLVEANWPKGRLLREYTVLLDPPTMAPAIKGSSAIAVAAQEPERATTQALPETRREPAAAPAPAAKPATVRNEPKPVSAPRAATGSDYGPVAAGETLGEIARATRPSDSVSVNQMMLALLKSNPGSFYKDNINALKRGAVLRIPSPDEIAASGSTRDAAVAVRSQIDEWRGGMRTTPTLVADTAPVASAPSKASAPSTATPSSGERLALVPPREGKAGQNAADRPSGGTAGGSGDVASKAELARIKEALTSREQETGELKSRVKDLEDIKGKNDKLINLQNTELAELRNKLKALQDAQAKPASAAASTAAATVAPATTAAATTTVVTAPPAVADAKAGDAKITKDDIWGEGAAKPANGSPVAPASAVVEPSTTNAAPAASDPNAASTTAPAAADATVVATPATAAEAAPVKPAAVEPKKEVKKPVAKPATPPVAATPWYMEPWALGAAGVGGLLLVLLGVAGMRKRKPAPAARSSIASTFGDSPIPGGAAAVSLMDPEEEELIAQVRREPTNAGAHLELLSLYYAQRETGKFEAAAEEMYAYIADPNQLEWRDARQMGEELAPNNPLFGDQGSIVDNFAGQAEEEYAFNALPVSDAEYRFDEPALNAPPAHDPLSTAAMPIVDFDFDLGDSRPSAAAPTVDDDQGFSFDDLPPLESSFDSPAVPSYDPPPPAPSEFDIDFEPQVAAPAQTFAEPLQEAISDDEFFAGEDAVGTKLDLAKAYLDMGDPEGARSMLEEVLVEGNALQQAEARKLVAEIH